jgi:OmpA-OmpF porin, OOP family
MRRTNLASLATLGALSFAGVIAPREAFAQAAPQAGYAVDHFETSERGSEWFALDSLDIRGHGRSALGVVTSWGYRPLVVYSGDKVGDSIVRNQIIANAGASFTLADRVRLGFNVPLQLFADGHTGFVGTTAFKPPADEIGVGDMRVSTDVRVFGNHGDAFVAGVGASLWIPSGDPASYTGDGKVRVGPRVQVAGDVGDFAYAARVGFLYRARDEAFVEGAIGSEVNGGVSAGYRFLDKKLLVGPELLASSVVSRSATKGETLTPVEVLLGLHYAIGEFRIGAGGGIGLTKGYGAPAGRGILSLEWAPDVTPPAPPPAAKDSDKDGIDDAHDACPFAEGPKSDDPKANGCPPPKDTDGDGLTDDVDACPRVAGPKTDDPNTTGCAVPPMPQVAPPPPCPDADRDKDGIVNEADACPDAAGKADPDPKKNGCPMAFVQNGRIEIAQMVRFKTDSADILGKDSEDVLTAVAKVLADHPEIKQVRIEGHTDDKGPADRNRTLSAARAASVVKWLGAHGVAADRMASVGHGPDKPLAPNTTEDGRTKNRRVEFHIVEK